ncbi:SocA family protein [Agrobacterium rhizogenes]|nr:SocA family protein [Rhizobium rhizogenes]
MYDARQIANWFVSRAARDNRRLTIMQLLKLVYISHGWHLEMQHSPLIINKIEAWKFGPVIPDVYNAFRSQGVEISAPAPMPAVSLPPSDQHLLEQIYNTYGMLTAQKLSDLTHEPGGPWDTATKQFGYFAPIPNELILPHYQQKRQRASA